ncbi:hypothetical protein CAEBREN_05798 [Caenorhabditis brenneri]|uniref:Uncharacterized protein n=1 Tax=Caenorhabditis brenneri TaxID=135651 RepID=G0MW50_CAEBE|nr:hypothetical protein CAEBREN_05798 [Caenorhabditis brenneri]
MAEPSTETSKKPIYELPAPRPEEELPEVDKSRHFRVERYWDIARDPDYSFDELDLTDDVCKKVILSEIRKVPDIWSTRKNQTSQSKWPAIAVAAFLRTGVLLSINSMKTIYKCAKDNLRNRLRYAIIKKHYSPKQVEEYLWGWDYYPFIRYYRKYLVKWEANLFKEKAIFDGKKHSNEEDWEPSTKKTKTTEEAQEVLGSVENLYENKEDDDMIWLDSKEANLSMKHRILEVKEEPQDELEEEPRPKVQNESIQYQVNHTNYPPNTLFMTQDDGITYDPVTKNTERVQCAEVVKQEVSNQEYPEELKPDISPVVSVKREMSPEITVVFSVSPTTRKTPPIVADYKGEVNAVTTLILQVFKEHPKNYKVLRNALYQTIIAFDNGNFASPEDLFKHLHGKS